MSKIKITSNKIFGISERTFAKNKISQVTQRRNTFSSFRNAFADLKIIINDVEEDDEGNKTFIFNGYNRKDNKFTFHDRGEYTTNAEDIYFDVSGFILSTIASENVALYEYSVGYSASYIPYSGNENHVEYGVIDPLYDSNKFIYYKDGKIIIPSNFLYIKQKNKSGGVYTDVLQDIVFYLFPNVSITDGETYVFEIGEITSTKENNDSSIASDIFDMPTNEMVQEQSTYGDDDLNFQDHLLQNVLDYYSIEKETLKLKCSVGNYYYDDELVICPEDKRYPSLIKKGDIVYPYIHTVNGEKPLSETNNEFEVIGVDFIYSGAPFQEITIQTNR